MNNDHAKAGGAAEDPAHETERLQHDIEAIRGNLGGLIGELDHRRHEVMDLRLQLRRHAVPLAIGAAALLALIGGGVALHVARKRRRQALPSRVRRLRQALARMIDEPDRVAKGDPHLALKIATSAGTAGAAIVGRRLAERLVNRAR